MRWTGIRKAHGIGEDLRTPGGEASRRTWEINRRAFLESPDNFADPRTFRNTFKALFLGSEKCFSTRPKEPRILPIFGSAVFWFQNVLVLVLCSLTQLQVLQLQLQAHSSSTDVHMNTAWQCQRCCIVSVAQKRWHESIDESKATNLFNGSLRRCYTRQSFLQLVSQFCCDTSCRKNCPCV